MFKGIKAKQALVVAMAESLGRHHLGVEQGVPSQIAVKDPRQCRSVQSPTNPSWAQQTWARKLCFRGHKSAIPAQDISENIRFKIQFRRHGTEYNWKSVKLRESEGNGARSFGFQENPRPAILPPTLELPPDIVISRRIWPYITLLKPEFDQFQLVHREQHNWEQVC